jgi:hypothetical protein
MNNIALQGVCVPVKGSLNCIAVSTVHHIFEKLSCIFKNILSQSILYKALAIDCVQVIVELAIVGNHSNHLV